MTASVPPPLLQQALARQRGGGPPRAAALCAQILAVAPENFDTLQLAGALALQLGRPAEAVASLERARLLRPGAVAVLARLGAALAALGRLTEAEVHARQALHLDHRSADAHQVLGGVLLRSGRVEEAWQCYQALTTVRPREAAGWVALGAAELQRSRPAAAVAACRRALGIEPAHPAARFVLGQAQLQRHDVPAALESFSAQLARRPQHHLARSFRLFALNYDATVTPAQLLDEHIAYGRTVRPPAGPRPLLPPDPSGRRLRLAFLSPDLRRHAVASFLEPLVAHLDRSRFELCLYHDHFAVDDVSRRLQARADRWRNFVGQGGAQVAAAVRADAPDVLVDLAGHSHHNRLELLATRLAPVQVTYLGYPNTTGVDTMDFRFTDAVADPPGDADRWHTETLVRFAPTAWAYAPPPEAPAVAPPPAAAGVPFTFGSFNNIAKLNDPTLRMWREVLEAVPGSRLLLKGLRLEEAPLRDRLAAAGCAPDRVICLPPAASVRDHLDTYARVDVALDPHPYNGTTTTCEALWMGVPVVTLRGDRHAARVGTSLVTAVGHPEWSAASPADYVHLAAGLATDPVRLAGLRAGLRGAMLAGPLLDHAGQAARFGRAIEDCVTSAASRQRSAA